MTKILSTFQCTTLSRGSNRQKKQSNKREYYSSAFDLQAAVLVSSYSSALPEGSQRVELQKLEVEGTNLIFCVRELVIQLAEGWYVMMRAQ